MIYDDDDPLRHLGSLREKDVQTKKDVRRSLWSGSKSSDPFVPSNLDIINKARFRQFDDACWYAGMLIILLHRHIVVLVVFSCLSSI